MVTIQNEEYECPYCGETFTTYADADECAKNCAMEERNLPEGTDECFICEYCEEDYSTMKQAKDCETDHIKNKDSYYEEYQRRKSFAKLAIAANHITQTTLIS